MDTRLVSLVRDARDEVAALDVLDYKDMASELSARIADLAIVRNQLDLVEDMPDGSAVPRAFWRWVHSVCMLKEEGNAAD